MIAGLDYAIEDYHSITSSASDSIANKGGQNIEFYLSNRLNISTLDTRFRPNEGSLISFFNKLSVDNFMLNKLSYDKYFNINRRKAIIFYFLLFLYLLVAMTLHGS